MSDYEDGWRHRGSCNNYNPDWWTPNDVHSAEARHAVFICSSCPVKKRCGDWAQANVKLCAGAIYGGVYYTAGGGTDRTIRRSGIQPKRTTGRTRLTQMPVDQIRQMADLGCTDKQIAAIVGSTEGSIKQARYRNNIPGGKLALV